jgi:stage V sporulation protein G
MQNENSAMPGQEAPLPMKISVKAYPVSEQNGGSLKGRAIVTLNDSFVITGVRVMDGKEGLFAAMPSQKGSDGKWYKICRPSTPEFSKFLNNAVVGAYKIALAEQDQQPQPHSVTRDYSQQEPAMSM